MSGDSRGEVTNDYMYPETPADPGYVYLIGSPDGYCKIGKTKEVYPRVARISLQLPYPVTLLHAINSDDMTWLERHLHQTFAKERMNGEWFKLRAGDIAIIRALPTFDGLMALTKKRADRGLI